MTEYHGRGYRQLKVEEYFPASQHKAELSLHRELCGNRLLPPRDAYRWYILKDLWNIGEMDGVDKFSQLARNSTVSTFVTWN